MIRNRYRCKDGTVRWLSWRGSHDPAARVVYATARDISDLIFAGKAAGNNQHQPGIPGGAALPRGCRSQKKYLRTEKLSAIGKLSASIAHGFNNPLQGIMTVLRG